MCVYMYIYVVFEGIKPPLVEHMWRLKLGCLASSEMERVWMGAVLIQFEVRGGLRETTGN